jgi:hypothetical protein
MPALPVSLTQGASPDRTEQTHTNRIAAPRPDRTRLYSNPVDFVLSLPLRKLRPRGPRQWSACCPAHDDRRPSLEIGVSESGKVLMHCHAGCKIDDICTALGVTIPDLFPGMGHRDRSGRVGLRSLCPISSDSHPLPMTPPRETGKPGLMQVVRDCQPANSGQADACLFRLVRTLAREIR